MQPRLLALITVTLISAAALPTPARAATTCVFQTQAQRLVLRGDCETDATISIPDGVTLDGRGHTIVAVDPPGGHFTGAILLNAGATANVRNVVLETRTLASVCDPSGSPDLRLAGIRFDGASGTISGNRVLDINQGVSGCQEGNAIEAKAAAEGPPSKVRITGNRVEGYQKTGIVVNDNVDATIDRNRVVGLGPVDFIGQNGIQLGFGARGTITRNQISQNLYTQSDAAGAGILLLSAGDLVEVTHNFVDDCDVGVWLVATNDALIADNRISNSTYDAIAIDGQNGAAAGSQIISNLLVSNAVGIGILGEGASTNAVEANVLYFQTAVGIAVEALAADNQLIDNRIERSTGYGIAISTDLNDVNGNRVRRTTGTGLFVAGTGNAIEANRVQASSVLDIENAGTNSYAGNRCGTSSGAPVDCP